MPVLFFSTGAWLSLSSQRQQPTERVLPAPFWGSTLSPPAHFLFLTVHFPAAWGSLTRMRAVKTQTESNEQNKSACGCWVSITLNLT
jgi:hypothetical protein